MEAEKSHHLPSASWRTRKTRVVILVQTWRCGTQGSQWGKFLPESRRPEKQELWWLRAGDDQCPNSSREQTRTFSAFLFYSGPSSEDWIMPTHIGKGDLLYPVYQSKCYCLLEAPSQTHSEMFSSDLGIPEPSQVDTYKSTAPKIRWSHKTEAHWISNLRHGSAVWQSYLYPGPILH